jgi:outer membrane protein TolC
MPETLPPPPALAWDEDQVRARAVLENPGLKGLAAKAAAARFQTDLLGRDGAPLVVARLGHSYDQNPYLVHPSQFSVYLGVTWKPFDGGTRSARVSQARADEGAVRLELEEARRQAGNAAVGAFREFRQALRELETAQLDVDAATENLRIVNEQYLHTYARGTEVLDAETVLAQSRFRLAERLCRAYTLQAALLAVLGEDLEAFYATTPPGALT